MRAPQEPRHPLIQKIISARITCLDCEQFLVEPPLAGEVDCVGKLSVWRRRGEPAPEDDDRCSVIERREERVDSPEHLGIVGEGDDDAGPGGDQGTHDARPNRGHQCRRIVEQGQPGELPLRKEGLHEAGAVVDDEVVDHHDPNGRLGVVLREGGSGPFG